MALGLEVAEEHIQGLELARGLHNRLVGGAVELGFGAWEEKGLIHTGGVRCLGR
jgi:hypothetical protein